MRDERKKEMEVTRAAVRARRIVSIAHIVVSNDKHHDSAFVQVAVPKIRQWLKDHGQKHHCGEILEAATTQELQGWRRVARRKTLWGPRKPCKTSTCQDFD